MTARKYTAASAPRAYLCMPIAKWPPIDAVAWATSLKPGDLLDPGGLASRWAPRSRRQVVVAYGRWLQWLEDHGAIDRAVGPAEHVTRDLVTLYADDLHTKLSPFTVASYIQLLNDALRAMAGDIDWKWIGRAPGRIREQGIPRREKRSRLQAPDRLVELGKRLMAEADGEFADAPLEAAILFRSGLSIAFLAYRPIRMSNLEMMKTGDQLVGGNGKWRVAFTAAEMKGRRPLEFPFPSDLVPFLERYLAVHRPVLLGCGERQEPMSALPLWVSRDGQQLGYQTLGHHIQLQTNAEFGARINAHLFRDCAATFIAIVDPDHARNIAAILSHASMKTSEGHYNQANDLEAGRQYHKTLDDLRMRTKRRRKAQFRHPTEARELPSAQTSPPNRVPDLIPELRNAGRDRTIVTHGAPSK